MRIRFADAAALVFLIAIMLTSYFFLVLPGQSRDANPSSDTTKCPAENKVTELKQNQTSKPVNTQNRVYLYAKNDETSGAAGEECTVENIADDLKAIDVLEKFYELSGSSDRYQDAINLLSDDFVMEMTAFEKLGIKKLEKADITGEFVETYAKIIGASKIEDILKDETQDGTACVSYIQSTQLGEGNTYRLGFKASLKRIDEHWKIHSLRQDNSLTENAQQYTGSNS